VLQKEVKGKTMAKPPAGTPDAGNALGIFQHLTDHWPLIVAALAILGFAWWLFGSR
jgi:hypothetical protein